MRMKKIVCNLSGAAARTGSFEEKEVIIFIKQKCQGYVKTYRRRVCSDNHNVNIGHNRVKQNSCIMGGIHI